jgi:hypothetical protein
LFSGRVRAGTCFKDISILKIIEIQINIDFDKVEKRDLFIFISELEQANKSDWLKHNSKIGTNKFYKVS